MNTAKTGLEILKELEGNPEAIAEIISKVHPPFDSGENIACDFVSCSRCWLAWLTTGKHPLPIKK